MPYNWKCGEARKAFVSGRDQRLFMHKLTCGKWSCADCRERRIDERLDVLFAQDLPSSLYIGTTQNPNRRSMIRLVNKHHINCIMVTFKAFPTVFVVLSDQDIQKSRGTLAWSLDREVTEDAIEEIRQLMIDNEPRYYQGHGTWEYVPASTVGHTGIGRSAERKPLQQALDTSGLKLGRVVDDVVKADRDLTEAQDDLEGIDL